ncbi:LytS/YhcK type 5TM receptor domain-containing protein [Citreimonas sp.]|uniref:LytS/YhcK type 5TM receptor domain-containing protein n=1 Tax=Citreimonas sp. TaxID=3036715 RepID=UPI0040594A72
MIELTLLAGWAGTLSLLGLVAAGYGMLARTVWDPAQLQLLAGALFGALALALMAMPLRVAEGVNLDPRNVPVALAAAFLGLRGGAVALLMAIGMRLSVGGAGTGAGIAALLFSAIAGFCWTQGTRPAERTARDYAWLGVLVGMALWPAVLLPVPAAAAVLARAVPLVLVCLIFTMAIAMLLDRAALASDPRRHAET